MQQRVPFLWFLLHLCYYFFENFPKGVPFPIPSPCVHLWVGFSYNLNHPFIVWTLKGRKFWETVLNLFQSLLIFEIKWNFNFSGDDICVLAPQFVRTDKHRTSRKNPKPKTKTTEKFSVRKLLCLVETQPWIRKPNFGRKKLLTGKLLFSLADKPRSGVLRSEGSGIGGRRGHLLRLDSELLGGRGGRPGVSAGRPQVDQEQEEDSEKKSQLEEKASLLEILMTNNIYYLFRIKLPFLKPVHNVSFKSCRSVMFIQTINIQWSHGLVVKADGSW